MATYLVDTNILLRSSDPASSSHVPAVAAVSKLLERGDQVVMTAQNLVEFWAVATRSRDENGLGWTIQEARARVDQLLGLFPLLAETPAIFTTWLQLVSEHEVRGKRVHDARLVAAMQAHGISHLLTLNPGDFRRFLGIEIVHPDNLLQQGSAATS
jgi:predicted nucleic acid-binding protein